MLRSRLLQFTRLPTLLPMSMGEGVPGGVVTPGAGGGSSGGSSAPAPSSNTGGGSSQTPGPQGAPLDSFRSPAPSSTPRDSVPTPDGANYDFMTEVFGTQPSAQPAQAEPPAAPGTTPAQEPAPAAQPQVPAPAQAPPPDQQQPPAAGQQGGQAQQPAQGPRFNPADPIGLAAALREPENNAVALEHLAQTVFNLSEKDLQDLEENVAGTVPKLLAKAVLHSQIQTLSILGHIMPLMMQNHGTISQLQSKAEDNFFAAWPQVDRAKHANLVAQLGVRYRQMNPNDTSEQMIERLGPFVLMQLGLPMVAMTKTGQAPAAQPRANGNGGQVPKPVAFQPAAPGAVVHSTQVPDDQFGFLGQRGE